MDRLSPAPWQKGAAGQRAYIFDANGVAIVEASRSEKDRDYIVAAPDLMELAKMVARLNPKAGEIGAGMLAQMQALANKALTKAGEAQ